MFVCPAVLTTLCPIAILSLLSLSLSLQGNIAEVVENANQMALRTDTTVKKSGSQKRDVDFINDYLGFASEYASARTAAEKAGSAFDDSAVLAKIKKALEVEKVDAELDAAMKKVKA